MSLRARAPCQPGTTRPRERLQRCLALAGRIPARPRARASCTQPDKRALRVVQEYMEKSDEVQAGTGGVAPGADP